jgi:L-ornithine N5-monooxygenase
MKQRTRVEKVNFGTAPAVLDVLGIGFGPANLALALCLEEWGQTGEGPPLRSLFLERKVTYQWHPNMLLDGAEVQVPFFKDLVTLRNPQSHFTFLNYLHTQGRLQDFVNLRTFFPTRREFNHYYCWVAAQLAHHVRYEREVLAIEPVLGDDGAVQQLRVVARHTANGIQEELLTRNLVVATGGVPFIPPGIDLGASEKVFHSSHFLQQVARCFPDRLAPYRFVVVGSGQSAAEIFQYLFSQYPNATVTAAMRRFAFKPADESEFVNEIYAPSMTDVFYGLGDEERRYLTSTHADTNYSAVDIELIRSIFKSMYAMKVAGETRVQVKSMRELRQVEQHGAALAVKLWNRLDRCLETLPADGVVLATGFARPARHPLLEQLHPYLLTTAAGNYQVYRDYRVRSVPGFAPRIYLQGFCEATHGISDPVLSVLPVRSSEIVRSLAAELAGAAARAAECAELAGAALLPSVGEAL